MNSAGDVNNDGFADPIVSSGGTMTMDALLGGLVFAAMILAQFAAVAAVHRDMKSSEPNTLALPHSDYRARLIWHSGG